MGRVEAMAESAAHLACPYCGQYGALRLYLASARVDSCECTTCGARWDENPTTGEFLGRVAGQPALTPHQR